MTTRILAVDDEPLILRTYQRTLGDQFDLLADIGRVTLPPDLNEKLKHHQSLDDAERRLVERVPEFSARLLRHIPRIDAVVDAVLYQDKHVNGAGFPPDGRTGREIPIASSPAYCRASKLKLSHLNPLIEPFLIEHADP